MDYAELFNEYWDLLFTYSELSQAYSELANLNSGWFNVNQFAATFIATLLALIFGFLLFYLYRILEKRSNRNQGLKYLKREMEFNAGLIKSYIENFEKMGKILGNNEGGIPIPFSFAGFQKDFFSECLRRGYLYDLFDNNKLSDLSGIFSFFSIDRQNLLNDIINRYISGELDVSSAKSIYSVQKSAVEECLKLLNQYKDGI